MKILMVEWTDSHSKTGWKDKSILRELCPATCITVGIATEFPEYITIHQSASNLSDVADIICIPRVAIKRIRRLRVRRGNSPEGRLM